MPCENGFLYLEDTIVKWVSSPRFFSFRHSYSSLLSSAFQGNSRGKAHDLWDQTHRTLSIPTRKSMPDDFPGMAHTSYISGKIQNSSLKKKTKDVNEHRMLFSGSLASAIMISVVAYARRGVLEQLTNRRSLLCILCSSLPMCVIMGKLYLMSCRPQPTLCLVLPASEPYNVTNQVTISWAGGYSSHLTLVGWLTHSAYLSNSVFVGK